MPINWDDFWEDKELNELINVDFFDGRQYVLKYLPSHGKIIEAGCGSGRYVIYLSRMGFDITGIDISDKSISICKQLSNRLNLSSCPCIKKDVVKTKFPDNHFSGYLSFGVIEHFRDGPYKVLREAYRILKPGGIVIITTPNKYSLPNLYFNSRKALRKIARKILSLVIKKYRITPRPLSFFQYWYSEKDLERFMKLAGFDIVETNTTGQLDAFWYLNPKGFKEKYAKYKYFNKYFSNSFLEIFGLHSVIAAVKPGESQHCFICGKIDIKRKIKNIPFCGECLGTSKNSIESHLNKRTVSNYICNIPLLPEAASCHLCNRDFKPYYLDFTQPICNDCRKSAKNIHFRNKVQIRQYKYINYLNDLK